MDPNYKVEPPWTLDEESKDTIGDLPVKASARGSARGSARDSVRTDMSTGRLEATMASLLAEKSVLMRRLNAVEKELRDDRKKNEPKKGPRRH